MYPCGSLQRASQNTLNGRFRLLLQTPELVTYDRKIIHQPSVDQLGGLGLDYSNLSVST